MWIFCKYYQILCKYCANISCQSGNWMIQEHKRLKELSVNYPLTHPLCENTIHWAAYAAKKEKKKKKIMMIIAVHLRCCQSISRKSTDCNNDARANFVYFYVVCCMVRISLFKYKLQLHRSELDKWSSYWKLLQKGNFPLR